MSTTRPPSSGPGGDTIQDELAACPACGGDGKSKGDLTVKNGCLVCRGKGKLSPIEAAAWDEAIRNSEPDL